jgi:hypothetical protein
MNFKYFGVLLSVSAVLGTNFIPTKALTQKPSIKFGKAIASGRCNVGDQLVGSDRTLSIFFDNMQAKNGRRQVCNIRVNTTIPSGFYVQDMWILYQGSTEVPPGSGSTSLSRSYIFSGGALGTAKAKPAITKFTSTNELFQVEDPITVASASCGGEGVFGINMILQSSPGTSIVVGSPDLAGRDVEIHVDLAPC